MPKFLLIGDTDQRLLYSFDRIPEESQQGFSNALITKLVIG